MILAPLVSSRLSYPRGEEVAAVRDVKPGIFLGAFAANATAGEPLRVPTGIAAGNTLEAFVGAAILGDSASMPRWHDSAT